MNIFIRYFGVQTGGRRKKSEYCTISGGLGRRDSYIFRVWFDKLMFVALNFFKFTGRRG
jgi:hypothetical protein